MVWRDVWDATPNVVVLAEPQERPGVLDDAVLFLGIEEPPNPVTVHTADGEAFTFTLPAPLPELPGMITGITLSLESQ